jgi:L-lactate dehydrogenase (cytochrome)
MVQRRLPRPSELRPLLRPAPFVWDADERRLRRAASIADLRTIARRRTPRAVFDYTDGAADGELSLHRARRAFARVEFTPTVLRDVSETDTSREILGRRSNLPFAFAPTGFTRMMHHEGERAVASVAQQVGIPYTLSTMGTTTIEDVATAAPGTRKWFQLYLWRDRAPGKDLVERAAAAGYDTLMLTVDTPVGGARLRDVRNGLTIPPSLTLRTFLDGALHPNWWFDFLTTEPLKFASLESTDGTVADLINRVFDPALTMADVEWLRSTWSGKLVVKGIQSVEDARRVVDAGADAIVLSNHGGRQLDRAPTPLRILPDVRKAVGSDAEIYLDTGIMSGADIVAAIALGADACLVGRAYLYGLMAGGQRGVARAAEILTKEVRRTMALLGVSRVADLNPSHVRLP